MSNDLQKEEIKDVVYASKVETKKSVSFIWVLPLIIVALIPLALKGVEYRSVGADTILKQNLLIYGLGGLILPFIGIKIIDVIIVALGLV